MGLGRALSEIVLEADAAQTVPMLLHSALYSQGDAQNGLIYIFATLLTSVKSISTAQGW